MMNANGVRHFFIVVFAALICAAVSQSPAKAETKFKQIPIQFIAASVERDAKSGMGAESWGLWRVDPGPRGERLASYKNLVSNGGLARAGWQFDANDWWLEEHGLIMEAPDFGMPAGKYLVTGDRETKAVLTILPKDATGSQRWELADGATIYDVTHLRCRAARYKPETIDAACQPSAVRQSDFPMTPGIAMPEVENCSKQDYAVLFIIGVEE